MYMKKTITAILLATLLVSCKEEIREGINSKSPDGKTTLSVSAKGTGIVEPWRTTLKADSEGVKGEVIFEFYAGDVSHENVTFVWNKEGNCVVTFTQRDDTQRVFEFVAGGHGAVWRDLTVK